MRGQGKINQGKLVARRRRRAFYLTLYTVAAAGLIFCALSYISGLQPLLISDVTVSGNSRLASTTVQNIALHDLAGTYLYFFPRADVLLYPRTQIRRDVLALPLVETATVSRSSMHTLAINVTERQTAALWCDQGCYALDENGLIFDKQDDADSGFIYRSDLADATSSPIGQQVVPPDEFKRVQSFMTDLAKTPVDPREVDLEASSTYMTVVLGQGGKFIINTTDDLSTVLGNIQAIIADKTVAPDLATFFAKLDYMKLDVGNKVVFKLK